MPVLVKLIIQLRSVRFLNYVWSYKGSRPPGWWIETSFRLEAGSEMALVQKRYGNHLRCIAHC